MTDHTGTSAPATPEPAKKSWWKTLASSGVAIVIIVIGGIRLIDAFTLPGCDSSTVKDTLTKIFTDKKVNVTKMDEIKSVPATDSKAVACEARIEITNEGPHKLEYTVTWDGWSKRVTIVKATQIVPKLGTGATPPK